MLESFTIVSESSFTKVHALRILRLKSDSWM